MVLKHSTSPCQPSCASPDAPANCASPPGPGCGCEDGSMVVTMGECVPASTCPCTDPSTNTEYPVSNITSYPAKTRPHWWTPSEATGFPWSSSKESSVLRLTWWSSSEQDPDEDGEAPGWRTSIIKLTLTTQRQYIYQEIGTRLSGTVSAAWDGRHVMGTGNRYLQSLLFTHSCN